MLLNGLLNCIGHKKRHGLIGFSWGFINWTKLSRLWIYAMIWLSNFKGLLWVYDYECVIRVLIFKSRDIQFLISSFDKKNIF